MRLSFFIKYFDYKTGIRLEFEHDGTSLISCCMHNQERQPTDEICTIWNLHKILRERFPTPAPEYSVDGGLVGDAFFENVLANYASISQNMYRKNPQARNARKKRQDDTHR